MSEDENSLAQSGFSGRAERQRLPTPLARRRRVSIEISPDEPLPMTPAAAHDSFAPALRVVPAETRARETDSSWGLKFLAERKRLEGRIKKCNHNLDEMGFTHTDRILVKWAHFPDDELSALPTDQQVAALKTRQRIGLEEKLKNLEKLEAKIAREEFEKAGIDISRPVTIFDRIGRQKRMTAFTNCEIQPKTFRFAEIPEYGYEPAVIVHPADQVPPMKLVGLSQIQQDT